MARTDEGGRPRFLEGSGLRLVLSALCADWGGQAAVDWPATRRHHPPLGRSHSPPRSCIPATMRLRDAEGGSASGKAPLGSHWRHMPFGQGGHNLTNPAESAT